MLRLREDGIAWREVDGETLLLDLRTSMYLTVNESAAVLWKRLAEGTTREAMVDALVAEFGITAERAGADVDAVLEECRDREYVDDDGAS